MEDQSILKISLHGMNERMQKMMTSYLKNNCNGLAVVVNEDEAQAEIVDVKKKSYFILEERLAQQPTKPIIALSSCELPLEQVIHVLKPITVPHLCNALNKVEKMLNINFASEIREPSLSSESSEATFLTLNIKSKVRNNVVPFKKKEGVIKSIAKLSIASSSNQKKAIKTKNNNSKVKIFNLSEKNKFDPKDGNRRSSVRYSFQSFNMILKRSSVLLGRGQGISVTMLNNSSKGAYIYLEKPCRLYGKVILEIQLDAQQKFSIPARIVRRESKSKYGLKFLNNQLELTECLINSGYRFYF